jgi:hypothetical protein
MNDSISKLKNKRRNIPSRTYSKDKEILVDHESEIELKDLILVNYFKDAWDLLNSSISSARDDTIISKRNQMMFCLSDVFLKFLLYSEESGNLLLEEKSFRTIFNQEIGAQMILNYVWGKFPLKDSITSSYANFDFQGSLESSPFTKELSTIWKC